MYQCTLIWNTQNDTLSPLCVILMKYICRILSTCDFRRDFYVYTIYVKQQPFQSLPRQTCPLLTCPGEIAEHGRVQVELVIYKRMSIICYFQQVHQYKEHVIWSRISVSHMSILRNGNVSPSLIFQCFMSNLRRDYVP